MRRHVQTAALTALLCFCIIMAAPAGAHDLALSGIRVLYRHNGAVVNVTTALSRLRRADGRGNAAMTPAELDQSIRRRLHVRFDGRDLTPAQAHVIADTTNDLLSWQTVVTGPVDVCEVMARLYPEDPGSRTVVSLIREGQVVQETLLDAGHPGLLRGQAPLAPWTIGVRYVREGIDHIFGGPDHILFILGLLLLGGTLKSLLRTVTAFTLAHSVTLTLAATGLVTPSPRLIEPLIALSIVAVAAENLRYLRRRKREHDAGLSGQNGRDLRPYFAFGFGLIHGFGFAGALAEVGLPQSALGIALASFNLGVELGQAAIVLLVAPVLSCLAVSRPVLLQRIVLVGSLVIGMAGTWWFFSRLIWR